MSYCMTVSPDFSSRGLPSWYLFNTWLQRELGERIRLELFEDFASQRRAIEEGSVDLIYANPFDAAALIRRHGFRALAAPRGRFDEALVAVRADAPAERVEDLRAGTRIATTDDPDVHTMCMILLEPADLNASNLTMTTCDSYVLVAKELIRGQADAGFFLESTFAELSDLVRSALRPLVQSQISVVRHALLVGPRLASRRDEMRLALAGMAGEEKGKNVLEGLGFEGFELLEQEDVEFMIDLMDTLVA